MLTKNKTKKIFKNDKFFEDFSKFKNTDYAFFFEMSRMNQQRKHFFVSVIS